MKGLSKSMLTTLLPFWVVITLNPLSSKMTLEQHMPLEAFGGYPQFLMVMSVIEIFILLFSMAKKQGIINSLRPSFSQEQEKMSFCEFAKLKLKKFALYVFKMIFVSILYYCVYVILFIVVRSACSIYIQQKIVTTPEASLQALEKPEILNGLGNTRQLAFESSPLSSTTGSFFSTNTNGAIAMAFSSDGNIAFLCTVITGTYSNQYFLNIVNISNTESPSLLGSVPLTSAQAQSISSEYNVIDTTYQMTMLLSPDEQSIFMSAVSTIEIFNVSNLTSPVIANSYTPLEGPQGYIVIASFAFMPDGESVAITVDHIEGNSHLIIANITNVLDINVISDETSLNFMESEIYLYEGLLWIGSDLSWDIYNASNLTQPQHIASLDVSDHISGEIYFEMATFSTNFQTIFYCYNNDNTNRDYCNCNIFNITNVTSSTQYTTMPISLENWSQESLAISPDNRLLFVTGGDFLQIFDVSNLNSPEQLNNISIPFPTLVTISEDGKRALVSTTSQVYAVELYFNIPANQFSNLQDNVIGIISPPASIEMVDSIVLSPDGDTLYLAAINPNQEDISDNVSNFEALNVSDPYSITSIPGFSLIDKINQVEVSPDGDTLFIAMQDLEGYNVAGIYNIESREHLSSFDFENTIQSFTISPDGNTLFVAWQNENANNGNGCANWTIINVTNLTSPTQIGYYAYDDSDVDMRMTISSDGNTAFLTGNTLRILNISDPSTPTPISDYSLQGANQYIVSVTISPDNQAAFLLTTYDGNSFLEVVNISSPSAPSFISSINIPDDSDDSDASLSDPDLNDRDLPSGPQLANISPDGNTLYIVASGLVILNISNLTDPTFLAYYSAPAASSLQISPDYSTAFLADYNQGVIVLNLISNYIFNMPGTAFSLGKTASSTLNVLARNSNNTYDASLMNYKFIGLSLYSVDYEPGYTSPLYNFTALPNWMDFDTSTGILTVSPNSNSQIGSYSLYGALSSCIENTAFLGVANITTIQEATQSMITLISLGYLDNQGYLTSAFDPDTPLTVGSQALNNETEVRQMLSEYYIEAMTTISVTSSLTLALGEYISINTLSLSPLNLQITLENTNNVIAKFVDLDYSLIPSFTPNYTTVSFVGSLLDVNLVLSQLIIFLNNSNPCNGAITVSDGLNYPLTQAITNISAYFTPSSQPFYNSSFFQSQIDKVSVATGDQFIIQFDDSTFQDPDGEDLTYTLAMQDSTAQVPDWLTLRGLDLIGTPPLQLNDRSIPLKIVASNQYQSIEANFTLNIGLSFIFILKLIGEYGGGLITVLGFIIYINPIYNILCKRRYRYPIDFTVKPGEEITGRTIYPIAFIGEALRESRFILKKLDKKIAAEIKNSQKSEIANYFKLENAYKINQVILTQCIEQTVVELLSTKDSDKLKLYVPGINSRRELIEQLIIKEMTMRLIDMKEQRQTKLAFKSIRNNLFSLIELEKSSKEGICEFSVVRSKLYQQLRINKIAISLPTNHKENKTELSNASFTSEGTEAHEAQEDRSRIDSAFLSVQPQRVNIDLLIDAIEAYTFKHHNMDADLLDIKIEVKEKIHHVSRPRTIKRFLKRDLIEINFVHEKRQLGYGLQYETRKGFLKFCGETDYDIKERTLAIQITNMKGRILREIWVHGVVDDDAERESLRESLIL